MGVLHGAQSLPFVLLPSTPAEDRTLAKLASGSQQSITVAFPSNGWSGTLAARFRRGSAKLVRN